MAHDITLPSLLKLFKIEWRFIFSEPKQPHAPTTLYIDCMQDTGACRFGLSIASLVLCMLDSVCVHGMESKGSASCTRFAWPAQVTTEKLLLLSRVLHSKQN